MDSCAKDPGNLKEITEWPLAGVENRGGGGRPDSGGCGRRQCGPHGVIAWGHHGLPFGGLIGFGGGWKRVRQ